MSLPGPRRGEHLAPEPGAAQLSIGDLAEQTGVSVATLRAWEQRHGFPSPDRLDSGHRRYHDTDVLAVRRVLERQEDGMRLDRAIAQALADVRRTSAPSSPSVFAVLRREHPHLPVQRLGKSTLLGLSWAIEDEFMARADRPHLFGAFQRGEYFDRAAARWDELARIARSTYALADFGDRATPSDGVRSGAHVDTPAGAVTVHLAATSPMRREWAVVCDSVDLPVALTAWELPGQGDVPDRERIFESVWTVDPRAVRDAARVCAEVAREAEAPGAAHALYDLADAPVGGAADLGSVSALFSRVLGYVDRFATGPVRHP